MATIASMIVPGFAPPPAATNIAALAKIRSMAGRPSKPLRSYPNRVRAVREAQQLSLEKVAADAGMRRQALQRYETGERVLRVPELERIAKAMSVPPQALLNSVDPVDDEQERAILSVFRRLPQGERDRIIRMATALISGPELGPPRKSAS
jgi:transcriptional regulator with XRE-family HTH domain